MPDVLTAVRSASVAEVAWRDADGTIHVRGVVPLVGGSGPVLAFPYADAPVARSIGGADEVLLTLTEPRSTGTGFEPMLLRCTPTVTEDREGLRFSSELLDQELRGYPPSRLLADSPLLRREHWWWLPRVLVDLSVTAAHPFRARSTVTDHLLVVGDGPLTAAVAGVSDLIGSADPEVSVDADPPGGGPAVLFGQDLSFPDLERWRQWSWPGTWDGTRFAADSAPARVGLPPPLGVLARWRRHRRLEKACRAALG
ncbi:pyridoxamine 5'-phosphate oxidase family protein [Nocardioides donggukensis]|uniref:Pyridoxamine 5'-phosphate oxidase family protein n=1 Tax=Nocardioides donggukensis TaxID=2774019 RepID=A0A927KA59_9ACTN|nr:pyridoxamine 5'-phosphate oxidase family protein [Nocardioides donggukensis]MBD8870581.1 pyridoxamine 5'-phosphate oxidase family protein [Nocardioides donggukensis]